MYIVLGIYSDIVYIVQVLSKFSKNPKVAYWDITKRVLDGFTNVNRNITKDCHAMLEYIYIYRHNVRATRLILQCY